MPEDNVYSDEPKVELSESRTLDVTLRDDDPPLFEIILDPDPDVSVDAPGALTGVVATAPPLVEVVPEAAEPTVDIVLEEQAIVDISAVGLQGPTGTTGPTGPTGPVGPIGPPGAAGVGASVDFVFDVPSAVWYLPHNLGRKFVDVVTVDSNDEELIGDVRFIDAWNAAVDWYYPTTGKATVST